MATSINCPQCAAANEDTLFKCKSCGYILMKLNNGSSPNDPLLKFIPYNNPYSLYSYYLAIFSLFPILGFFTGLASITCGIIGLNLAKKTPEVKGKIHCWVGIILSTLIVVAHVYIIVLAAANGK